MAIMERKEHWRIWETVIATAAAITLTPAPAGMRSE
jgi:hypothetical protein